MVRDLYKRAILVGRDYPHPRGLNYVREQWKRAISETSVSSELETIPIRQEVNSAVRREKEMRKLVGKGRYAIREMIGVIQLKKYRTMRRRYNGGLLDVDGESERIKNACNELSR